jgi:hypothetical protein
MNELHELESLGLTLPTPWYIAGSLLFSLIGYIVYRRGKKASLPRLKWLGVVLMFYPYAVSETWLLYVLGIALCCAAYVLSQ